MMRCRSLAEMPVRRVEISNTARNHILNGLLRLLQQRARRQARLVAAVGALERSAIRGSSTRACCRSGRTPARRPSGPRSSRRGRPPRSQTARSNSVAVFGKSRHRSSGIACVMAQLLVGAQTYTRLRRNYGDRHDRQVYGYAFHRPKLEFVRRGALDDKRSGDTRFAALAEFLGSGSARSARTISSAARRSARPRFASASSVGRCLAHHHQPQGERRDADGGAHHPGRRQQQAASRDAAAIHARQRQRHGRDRDPDLARRRPTSPRSKHSTASSSRRGWVRPSARSPATSISCRCATAACTSSTTSPMRAPTSRSRSSRSMRSRSRACVPGLKLFDIKCAWFNEEEYCEIFPRTLFRSR